jgi:hypothetical protein
MTLFSLSRARAWLAQAARFNLGNGVLGVANGDAEGRSRVGVPVAGVVFVGSFLGELLFQKRWNHRVMVGGDRLL